MKSKFTNLLSNVKSSKIIQGFLYVFVSSVYPKTKALFAVKTGVGASSIYLSLLTMYLSGLS